MPDIMRIDAVVSEKPLLERKQAQKPADRLANPCRTARTPCPNLRCNQIDNWNTKRFQLSGYPQVEIRTIGQEREVRPFGFRVSNQLTELAVDAGQMRNNFKKSHYRETVRIYHDMNACRLHTWAGAAEEFGIGEVAAQSLDQRRRVKVAGGLAGRNQDLSWHSM